MVQGTRGGGRPLPAKLGDYQRLGKFTAVLALDLVTLIKTRYRGFTGFLDAHMADPDAPSCIAGDPGVKLSLDNAKRALSQRIGSPATRIAEWELVEFLVRHCGPDDPDEARALLARLAGYWLASERYPPPGYRGLVDVPEGAPPPYASADDAPDKDIALVMLREELSQLQDNSQRLVDEAVSELREAHERSWAFYEREITEVRGENERLRDAERLAIRVISTLVKERDETPDETQRRLHAEAIALRQQVQDLTEKLNRETAERNLTTNRFAFVAACLDALGADPVQWLRTANFPLAADLYALLNHPAAAPSHTPSHRFLVVLLRTYLLSWFGDATDRDDTIGLYRDLVRNGVLPPADVLQSVLDTHTITLQVVKPLLEEVEAAEAGTTVPELTTGTTTARPLDVLGNEHHGDALNTLAALVQRLACRPPAPS